MHDLTTGSLSRHLLKTSGFMLIAMVFQTLYVLIDLYGSDVSAPTLLPRSRSAAT